MRIMLDTNVLISMIFFMKHVRRSLGNAELSVSYDRLLAFIAVSVFHLPQ